MSESNDVRHGFLGYHGIPLDYKTLKIMTKNLETADTVVKLTLAVSVIVFYSCRVIAGPIARGLLILAVLVLMLFAMKVVRP